MSRTLRLVEPDPTPISIKPLHVRVPEGVEATARTLHGRLTRTVPIWISGPFLAVIIVLTVKVLMKIGGGL